jgi:hypothetical protein
MSTSTVLDQVAEAEAAAFAYYNKLLNSNLASISALIRERGDLYDAKGTVPVWQKMPFGDTSFMTLVFMKAQRARAQVASDVHPDALRDSLRDLAAYTIMYLAWLDMTKPESF